MFVGQGNRNQKTAGKPKSGGNRAVKQQEAQELPEFLRAEVMIILSLAAAILLFLSNFHLCGAVGDFLRGVQLGLFGMVGYAFPVLLFMGVSFYQSNSGSLKAIIKLTGVIGMVLTICGLAQMIFGIWPGEGDSLLAFYRESSLSGGGGGLIGGLLAAALKAVVGTIGTYLLLIALLVICCVFITEKSVVNAVKRGSGRAYQHAKEDAARRREEWEELREERRRGRDDNVVRGVDFGSIKIQETLSGQGSASMQDVLAGQRMMQEMMAGQGSSEGQAAPEINHPVQENMAQEAAYHHISAQAVQTPQETLAGFGQADVFSGKIEFPPEYMEPVPFEEDSRAGKDARGYAQVQSTLDGQGMTQAGKAGTGGTEEGRTERSSAEGKQAERSSVRESRTERSSVRESRAERSSVEESRVEKSGAEERAKVVSFPERSASVRKNEPLYARREMKTLEELDMSISDLEASLNVPDWEELKMPGDVDTDNSEDDGYLDTDYREDEVFFDDDGFDDARYLRTPAARTQEKAVSGDGDAWSQDNTEGTVPGSRKGQEEERGRIRGLAGLDETEFLDDEDSEMDSFPFGGVEDDFSPSVPAAGMRGGGLTDIANADDWEAENEADSTEEHFAKDSFFTPEEPKRVVTASGKVIETETELLHKKLERRREEAAAEGNTSQAVSAQVNQQKPVVKKEYVFPPTTLLQRGNRAPGTFSDQEYKDTAIKLQQTLKNFGVGVTVTNISCGPSVTRYELHPEQGVKVSKIVGLTDDIKLSLAAAEIRIEAPIPGKSAVGIEVPNKETATVYLRDLLESEGFLASKSKLTFAVGKDIGGQPVMADIAKMPHLLIAGATGSGKSVCINTLIMSIIFKSDPEDVKLIMVDPKVVELSVYNGIPHLLIPVVTDPKKASGALNWAVAEMEDRYRKFAQYNVRNLQGYNDKIKQIEGLPKEDRPQKMPQIVIIIDELADLMMVVPGEVEDAICRLAQLARAAGIHLVIATQRPSVNVITGLIKANVPSRIAFAVSSGVDSRTIIDMNGAEKLLGKGDMLFFPSGIPKPQRVQGAFVSDQEVSNVVEFLTDQGLTAEYNSDVESRVSSGNMPAAAGADTSRDEYFAQAGKFIIEKEKASIGMLQRVFKIGFNRAARIMDQLADAGVVGEEEGTKPRKILMTMEEFEQMLGQNGIR